MTKEERKARRLLRLCELELQGLIALVKWWAPEDKVPRTIEAEKLKKQIGEYFAK